MKVLKINQIVAALLIIAGVILSYSPTILAIGYSSPEHDRVASYFKSSEEKSVFEAVWFNPWYLKVTRYDTGDSQNGFAGYICAVLSDFGFKGQRIDVEIIDVVKLLRREKWVVLGEATCR